MSGWAHKKDSGNLESIKFLSYRGSWAQARGLEKKESIRFRRLGTAASLLKNGLQNHDDFVGLFYGNHWQYPTGIISLEIHGFQNREI